jgi:two-component system NtrC family response regulator
MYEIVVVEDDPAVAVVVAEALSTCANVQCAASTDQAIDLLSSRPWSLAVLDVMLNDGSGLELAEIAARNNTPVMLIAGHPKAMEALEKYGFPHMAKPFAMRDFVNNARLLIAQRDDAVAAVKRAAATMREETGDLWC